MFKILDEEKDFFAHIKELIAKVEKNGKIVLSKFLTLREQKIVSNLVRNKINYDFYGGYDYSERKRCLLYPKDYELNHQFNICCFKINYNKKFLKLEHQNVLGTLMSLQFDRSLFGDIVFVQEECFVFIAREIKDVIKMDFNIINKVPISLEMYYDKLDVKPKYIFKEIIVSSMRIDNIISKVFKFSRDKGKKYILASIVYQNFQLVVNPSSKCELEDIISLRRYGRFIISRMIRKTKTNKFVLEIKIPT